MIPADLTARLRLLTEASFFSKEPPEVAALRASQEISEDLPEFLPGQRIVATLREARAEDTFRALINGREYTLTLPKQQARAGQTLDLVVTESTPKTVLATVDNSSAAKVSTSLSPTGRLISFLLTGQPPASAASLAAGKPLLNGSTPSAATLAPLLRQAVGESGLFYESQLGRWLSGAVSTESLLRQPQGLLGGAAPPPAANQPATPTGAPAEDSALRQPPPAPVTATPPRGSEASPAPASAEEVTTQAAASTTAKVAAAGPGTPIPERLLPVVHQQLDALATHQYIWQGMVWPGQTMEWEIDEPLDERQGGGDGEEARWKTTLRLSLPRLGGIEAQLHLTPAGVALRIDARQASSVEALRAAERQLADALAAANVPLTGMSVQLADAAGRKP